MFPLLLTSSIQLDTSQAVSETSQLGILDNLSLESRKCVESHTVLPSTSATGPGELNGSSQCITFCHLSCAMIAVCTSWLMKLIYMLFPVVLFLRSSVQSNSPAFPEEQTQSSEPLSQAGATVILCQLLIMAISELMIPELVVLESQRRSQYFQCSRHQKSLLCCY